MFRDEVGVMHKILGHHSGDNLGKYFMLFLDHVGVTSQTHSNLHCTEVEECLEWHGLPGGVWKACNKKLG